MKTVCGRAARAARLTAEAQNLERSGPYMSVPFRLLSTHRRGEMEARWRRDGSETEASWRRAGGETQTEASWRRDADGGGGEMADAGERRGRDGGEMEARRGRDGGGDATRVAATRVARAARLVTNTNPNPNQSAEPRRLAAAPNQSIQHSK